MKVKLTETAIILLKPIEMERISTEFMTQKRVFSHYYICIEKHKQNQYCDREKRRKTKERERVFVTNGDH